jgi:hypothetical protein
MQITSALSAAYRSMQVSPSIMNRPSNDTDPEVSAPSDRQANASNSVSFLGLSPPQACKTVSFFVSFH